MTSSDEYVYIPEWRGTVRIRPFLRSVYAVEWECWLHGGGYWRLRSFVRAWSLREAEQQADHAIKHRLRELGWSPTDIHTSITKVGDGVQPWL